MSTYCRQCTLGTTKKRRKAGFILELQAVLLVLGWFESLRTFFEDLSSLNETLSTLLSMCFPCVVNRIDGGYRYLRSVLRNVSICRSYSAAARRADKVSTHCSRDASLGVRMTGHQPATGCRALRPGFLSKQSRLTHRP